MTFSAPVTTLLAANNFGDTSPGAVAGPLGLVIVILLLIATVLLIRNMNKRIRRLPKSFPDKDAPTGDQTSDSEVEPSDNGRSTDR